MKPEWQAQWYCADPKGWQICSQPPFPILHVMSTKNASFNDKMYINGNPCQVVDDIHSIFNDTMQKHTPLQPLSRHRRKLLNKPWITQALYKSIKEKNKIYWSLVKNGFENKDKFACYKRHINQLTHLLVLSKKELSISVFNCKKWQGKNMETH